MRRRTLLLVLCLAIPTISLAFGPPAADAQADGWGPEERVDPSGGVAGLSTDVEVAVDPAGNAIAVWAQFEGQRYGIWANRYAVGAGWGEAERILTDEEATAEYPQVAADASGNAIAVWVQDSPAAGHRGVYANRYVIGSGWGTSSAVATNDTATVYDARIALDASGNGFSVWTFSEYPLYSVWTNRYAVGAGWGTPELLQAGAVPDAGNPSVAVDPSGNATATWEEFDGLRYSVYASRYAVGVGWGAPELIEADDTGDAGFSKVAVDSAGNAVAVWQNPDNGRGDIFANRYVVGVGWGTAEPVEANDTESAEDPEVACDADGNAVAVWYQRNATIVNAYANLYAPGTGWGTPVRIEANDTADVWDLHVGMSPSGDATAVWAQVLVWEMDIYANRYVAGSGWGSPELLETEPGSAFRPEVAVGAGGTVVAAWEQDLSNGQHIVANRYVVGSGWGTAELVEVDLGDAQNPDIAVDSGGNATAVWEQDDGAHWNVYANRYVVGTGWGTATLIETNDTGDAGLPQVAIDAGGNAVAVWRNLEGGRGDIWSNRYVVGTGWGTATLIETNDTGSAWYPRVAVDPAGNAIVVWRQYEGLRAHIFANRYVVGVGWGTAELVEADAETGDSPEVAVDPAGNAVMVWDRWDGFTLGAYANRYAVGSGWGAAELLAADASSPGVGIGSDGIATAVWAQDGGSRGELWSNRFVPGSGWGAPQRIEADDGGSVGHLRVAVGTGGDAVAVWDRLGGMNYTVWANEYAPGTGWGAAGPIETDGTGYPRYPEVAVDPSGNAVAVWVDSAAMPSDVRSNRYVAGWGWGTPQLVEGSSRGEAEDPAVAVDPAGNAIAVWGFIELVRAHVWASRYTPPVSVPPVADAGPDQTVRAGDLVAFDGSASRDDRGIASYNWTFDDGGLRTLWGVSPTYSFHDPGLFVVSLTVWDADGNNGTDAVVITVEPAVDAERPVADAGPEQTVPAGAVVTFDGSGSTDNVGIVNHTWTFNDGGTRTLYGASPTHRFDNAGVFVVRLAVRDAAGNRDEDTVVITVTPPPDAQDPVADAGADRTILAGDTAVLDATGSTDDVGIVNYTWTFDDGGARTRYAAMFAYRFDNVGAVTFTLTVRDAAGNRGMDTVVIAVDPRPDTERPIADAGPDQVVAAGATVSFDGSGSWDNVGIVNYTWSIFDAGPPRLLFGVAPTYTFSNAGDFVAGLIVRDAAGNQDADDLRVRVTPPPDTQAPVADAGADRTILAGDTIVLDGSASTDNVGIVNYTWTFTDGGARARYTSMFAYRFDNVGAITLTLTVRDAAGRSDTDTVVVTVSPPPDTQLPVANAGPDHAVVAGATVTFDGSGSTDNIGIVNYTWMFNDGGARAVYGMAPQHTFANPGVFVVTLTVRDAAGLTDSDAVVVTVTAPADTEDPVARAGPDVSVYTDVSAILDGSASTDDVGIVNYTWTFTYGGTTRTLYGPVVVFPFAAEGATTVTLTVRDAAGNTATDSLVVTAAARPGGGGPANEVVSPLALGLVAVLAIVAAAFAALWLLSRRKGGKGPAAAEPEAEAGPEGEAPQEEAPEEPAAEEPPAEEEFGTAEGEPGP